MDTPQALSLDHISVTLGHVPVLHDISLSVVPGEFLSIIGPNGCGKSTLLKVLCHMIRPQSGQAFLEGRPLSSYSRRQLARRMAILTQKHDIPEDMTVYELVSLGRFPYRTFYRRPSMQERDIIEKAMADAGIQSCRDRLVHTLSGGEQQRAFLAMTLAQEPQILLLDEPTTYLDIRHQLDILELLQQLNETLHLTIVLVLHDMNQALRYSRRTLVMKEGRIVAQGRPQDVITPEMIHDVFSVSGEAVVTASGRRVLVF